MALFCGWQWGYTLYDPEQLLNEGSHAEAKLREFLKKARSSAGDNRVAHHM